MSKLIFFSQSCSSFVVVADIDECGTTNVSLNFSALIIIVTTMQVIVYKG